MSATFTPDRASDIRFVPSMGTQASTVQAAIDDIDRTFYEVTETINAEEARSDIRSTTRPGYSSFNSYAGLQALFNALPAYAQVYLPPRGIFDFGAGAENILTMPLMGQGLISVGKGAEVKNGIIKMNHRLQEVSRLYLTGVAESGIIMGMPAFYGSDHRWTDTWNHNIIDRVHISDKTYGIKNTSTGIFADIKKPWIANCATGILFDHSSGTQDTGDIHVDAATIIQCDVGIDARKVGGLYLNGGKIMSCTDTGLLIKPTSVTNSLGPRGIYVNGTGFENSTSWDVRITAGAGVPASAYPTHLTFVGARIQKLLLDICNEVAFTGVHFARDLAWTKLQQNVGALNVMFTNCQNSKYCRTGAGTSYIDVGYDTTDGAYIKTGARLKLFDSVNPTGKIL